MKLQVLAEPASPAGLTSAQIKQRVTAALPDAAVYIAGQDCSFSLRIVSEAFAGQSKLARQQQLLGLFGDELRSGIIHALSISAHTPAELEL